MTSRYPNAKFNHTLDLSGDILTTVELNGTKIGFESQGDPNSRVITQDTLRKLADKTFNIELGDCDIIICAVRTEGNTIRKVDEIALKFGYHTIWISVFGLLL